MSKTRPCVRQSHILFCVSVEFLGMPVNEMTEPTIYVSLSPPRKFFTSHLNVGQQVRATVSSSYKSKAVTDTGRDDEKGLTKYLL